jgi:hypothetical protein
MIRAVKPFLVPWHAQFLSMLPKIRAHAVIAFRHLKPEAREESIQEAVANALVAFVRLVQLKKVDLAYPTVLARYAVAQIHDGRKVGNRLNIKDVLSGYAQKRKDFHVERLDQFDVEENAWAEVLVEDRHAGPAEVATTKIDFTEWLKSLPTQRRKITKLLATGERTSIVAEKFGVSSGRISQLRCELARSWKEFLGEAESISPIHESSVSPAA